MAKTAKVTLVGSDGKTVHAKGELTLDIIASRELVERNGHVYSYSTVLSNVPDTFDNAAVYRECTLPYRITEF